jgi:hypothetical protein
VKLLAGCPTISVAGALSSCLILRRLFPSRANEFGVIRLCEVSHQLNNICAGTQVVALGGPRGVESIAREVTIENQMNRSRKEIAEPGWGRMF